MISAPPKPRPAVTTRPALRSINDIVTEIDRRKTCRNYCRQIARPDLADDLYQEFILALLTYPQLPGFYNKPWFGQFCTRIITNLYRSPPSTFFKLYRSRTLNE